MNTQLIDDEDSRSFDEIFLYAKNLFPYDNWNKQQLSIINSILALKVKEKLFIEAATGSGKTIATLTALLAKKRDHQKILIFTRTVSQMEAFLREWGRIYPYNKLDISTPKILPLLGKRKTCTKVHLAQLKPNHSIDLACNSCLLHPDNPNRMQIKNNSRYKLKMLSYKISGSSNDKSPRIDDLIEYYKGFHDCGYYSQRNMLPYVSIVIATYPFLRGNLQESLLKKMGSKIEDTLILIDEAHNLISEKRFELTHDDLLFVRKLIGPNILIQKLLKIKGQGNIEPSLIAAREEWDACLTALTKLDSVDRNRFFLTLNDLSHPSVQKLSDFIRNRDFGTIISQQDRYISIEATPDYLEHLNGHNVIYMSGTFYPIEAYMKLYNSPNASKLITQSESRINQFRCYLTQDGITSKQNRRGLKMFALFGKLIFEIAKSSPRHTLVICPSYDFKNQLMPLIHGFFNPHQILEESKDMDLSLINSKIRYSLESMIIIAVSSGKISEGVEFVKKGQSLLSTVIFCGIPYKPPSDTDQFIINKLSSTANDSMAFQFKQRIPVIRAVKQAFGRSIRSVQDKGALILLDFRASSFHADLELKKFYNIATLCSNLDKFFENYPKIGQI
ncbi:MAG: DEAD/DEAH box helicase family protein [Candidatus Heimdallarchaeota archaeon]|nr:DEAD/DEAH box helicase family protein [Candidatus Heimdallarchaeota archaeon]MDH5645865.1 DEAD/DEAH box helicase family protein [Candidatus Heimdallarchaeota archaeon]